MGNTRDTGYLQNLVTYDASGNIVLPANLTVNGNLLVATQSYVTTQISNLINGAPALLDTLDELAAALGDDASFASTVTTSIAGKQAQLNGTGFVKVTGTTVSYDNSTYLTTSSASSTYVSYTGATQDVNLGVYSIATNSVLANQITVNPSGSTGAQVFLKHGSSFSLPNGFGSIGSSTGNQFRLYQVSSEGVWKGANISLNSITSSATRTYTLPDADGTLALTSSLSGYLPLTGGTLTGPLNGTSAAFSSTVTAGGQVSINSGFGTSTPAISIYNNTGANVSNVALIDFRLNNTFGGNERVASITALNPNASANNGGALVFSVSANGTATTPTEDMRITSAGNVGIGTHPTNPGKKLEITDENNSTSTTSGLKIVNWSLTVNARAGIVFQSYDNNGAAIWSNRTGTTTGELIFGTNNSASTAETNIAERMRIYSDGVVTTRIIQLNDPTYFASNYYGIRLAGVDNGVNGTNFQIQGRTSPTGGFSTLFTITNGGAASFNGTASFSNAISPNGGVYALGDVLTSSGRLLASNGSQGANTETASILLGNRGYFTTSDIGAARISAVAIGANWYSGTGLAFYTNPGPDVTSTGAEERMRISSNGNVGISTTSPTTRLDIGNGTLTLPTLRGRTYQLSNVSSQNPNFINGTGFNSIPVRVGDYIDLPFGQTRIVTAVTDTQLTVNSAWSVSFGGSNVEGRGGIIFQTNNADRMHITSDNSVLIPGNIQFASILPTVFNISLSGMSAGSWFNLTAFNFNGFSGLVTVTIPNLDPNYGYISQSNAWIFQQGANQENAYNGIRGVTIRPDGVSYEGYDVVESYHTAPVSGRANMRMRLRPRDAGLGAANPINLQIWVDHTVGITAGTPTLSIKRI